MRPGTDPVGDAGGHASQPKPIPIEYTCDEIPAYLRERAQWVSWRYDLVKNNKGEWKWTKVPHQATRIGAKASTTNQKTWATFKQAVTAYENPIAKYDGIGYCVDHEGGEVLTMTDLDHVVTWTNGKPELDPVAQDVVATLASYTEFSVSGDGIHTLAFGPKPEGRCKKGHLEMYGHARFFTFTGRRIDGAPPTIEARPEQILTVHAKYLADPKPPRADIPPAAGPVNSEQHSDAEVMAKARGPWKNQQKFLALYDHGDHGGYESPSNADMALCGTLAFWAGPHAEQIDRLFRASALMREKWTSKRGPITLGLYTIANVLKGRSEFYSWPSGANGSTGKREPRSVVGGPY